MKVSLNLEIPVKQNSSHLRFVCLSLGLPDKTKAQPVEAGRMTAELVMPAAGFPRSSKWWFLPLSSFCPGNERLVDGANFASVLVRDPEIKQTASIKTIAQTLNHSLLKQT